MVEERAARYAGHASLAEMVEGHIDVWRDGLKLRLDRAYNNLHGEEWTNEKSYIEHEMRALDAIEKAVEKDLGL